MALLWAGRAKMGQKRPEITRTQMKTGRTQGQSLLGFTQPAIQADGAFWAPQGINCVISGFLVGLSWPVEGQERSNTAVSGLNQKPSCILSYTAEITLLRGIV